MTAILLGNLTLSCVCCCLIRAKNFNASFAAHTEHCTAACLRVNMNVKPVKMATVKEAGLLFAVGCITTMISSYHATYWWQQTYSPALTVWITVPCHLRVSAWPGREQWWRRWWLHILVLIGMYRMLYVRAFKLIRSYLSRDTAISIARCIVASRLDYCNRSLYDTSKCNLDRLQRVLNLP